MTATKEQERKALEKIKKIVEELGEDSYVGAAFEGCFEMAESNIESDFGCSYKQSYEKALEDENYFKDLAERKSAEKDELQKQLDDLSKRVLKKDDLEVVSGMVFEYQNQQSEKVHESERNIVKFCESTDSKEFQKAVWNRRAYTKAYEQARDMANMLYEIKKAY